MTTNDPSNTPSSQGSQGSNNPSTPGFGFRLPPDANPGSQQQQLQTQAPIALDAATLTQILEAVTQKKKVPPPPVPRVGGVNENGAWTGNGAAHNQKIPRTIHCMRKLKMDEAKSYSQLVAIEDRCRKGLKSMTGPLFCLESEPEANQVVTVLMNLQKFLEAHGMEPPFEIIAHDGSKTNMLQQPGLINKSMLRSGIKDLTTDGVNDPAGRLPVCSYDQTNLDWSYDAVINSCSAKLERELDSNLDPADRNGPMALFEILQLVYRHSDSRVERITKQIENLNLRDFPGQNVTLFKQKMDHLLEELEMNLPPGQSIPTLRTKALKGLTMSTYPFFQSKVLDMTMAPSIKPNQSAVAQVKQTIKEVNDIYITLMEQDCYPPGKQANNEEPKVKALQAEVKEIKSEMAKLTQDRSASSTSNRKGKGGSKKGNGNSNGNSDSKPKSSDSQSSSPSGILKNGNSSGKSVSYSSDTKSQEDDDASKLNRLIKEKIKTLPPRKEMPADAEYKIEMHGKVVAEYCQKCRRFTKGEKKHSTKEHVPRKASQLMAQSRSLHAQSRSPPAAMESEPAPPSVVSFSPPVDYSRAESLLQRSGGYFAATAAPQLQPDSNDDDDSCGSVNHHLLATLNSRCPKE